MADLIRAETEAQRRQALALMGVSIRRFSTGLHDIPPGGQASAVYAEWRRVLLRCVAHVEAFIDFAEDENIESDILAQTTTQVRLID